MNNITRFALQFGNLEKLYKSNVENRFDTRILGEYKFGPLLKSIIPKSLIKLELK